MNLIIVTFDLGAITSKVIPISSRLVAVRPKLTAMNLEQAFF